MTEKPLYQDSMVRIEYAPSEGGEHMVWLRDSEDGSNYFLSRGVLNELALTPRGEMAVKLERFNSLLLEKIVELGIGPDGIHVAVCQAYAEEERRLAALVE